MISNVIPLGSLYACDGTLTKTSTFVSNCSVPPYSTSVFRDGKVALVLEFQLSLLARSGPYNKVPKDKKRVDCYFRHSV